MIIVWVLNVLAGLLLLDNRWFLSNNMTRLSTNETVCNSLNWENICFAFFFCQKWKSSNIFFLIHFMLVQENKNGTFQMGQWGRGGRAVVEKKYVGGVSVLAYF